MNSKRSLWYCVLLQMFGLGFAGWHFRHALNTDAVAYLRIASYYANGQWHLAVSGYWGPLLSWLMVPFLRLGLPALVAARVVMALSALVFFRGNVAVYRAFALPEKWMLTGAWLSALAGVYWSVQFITPDLLVSGLVCFAASSMLNGGWRETKSAGMKAGLFWGLAYLAKAVVFPLAILVTLAAGGLSFFKERQNGRGALRSVLLTLLTFGLVAAPWVLTLSLKYHTPTFSTAGRINQAIVGPPDVERYHPFARTFHQPELGRVTSWEDPSPMAYRSWSPFESAAYACHQFRLIALHVSTCLWLLTSLNLFWLVLPGAGAFRLLRPESRAALWRQPWVHALFPVALLVLIYLPFAEEQRFFYAAFPFLFTAIALWLIELAGTRPRQSKAILNGGWWTAALGAIAPLVLVGLLIGDSTRLAGDCAHDLARRIQSANLSGPIAGSGLLPGGRTGLYVAYLLNQPWCGDEQQPTPESLKTSRARLIVVNRHSALAAKLDGDPDFENLDARLFTDASTAAGFPLKVYQLENRDAVVK